MFSKDCLTTYIFLKQPWLERMVSGHKIPVRIALLRIVENGRKKKRKGIVVSQASNPSRGAVFAPYSAPPTGCVRIGKPKK